MTGKRVAIVGTGPAGLAAASGLLARGYQCVLFDRAVNPGGMLRQAFDEVRLPRVVVDAEVEAIRRRGAEFRMNTALGRDVSMEQLRAEFGAVLLATGAPVWRGLECEGANLAMAAGDLMSALAQGEKIDLECDVVVVGGGQEALEVALTARRHKAASVTILSPRPAAQLNLIERTARLAQASGVKFVFETTIREIRQPAVRLYIDAESKAGPVKLDCNLLINASGREVDVDLFAGQGVQAGPRGVATDRATLATGLSGVFAAGDVAGGAGFCVRAVAQGLAAAESIDQYLRGMPVAGPRQPRMVRYGKLTDEERAMLLARSPVASGRHARIPDDATARVEAGRCLDCGCADNHVCRLRQAATEVAAEMGRFKGERRAMERDASHPLVVYESNKCIMCGACVRICEREGASAGLTCVGRGFNVRVAAPWAGTMADALGELAEHCAAACPTSAIVLKTASK